MSIRGVISGVAGSAGVAVVAALSLGMTHAAADSSPSAAAAHALVAPASPTPALRPARGPTVAQPQWLRRLLQRRDPPVDPAPLASRPMEAAHRRS